MAISALDTFNELGLTTTSTPKKEEESLAQADFLELMTTQLTHQNPLEPMENGDFLAQMAQFSTVEGIGDLNDSFADFASSLSSDQALQAANLVGRTVNVPSGSGLLEVGGNIKGNFDLPDSSLNVNVKIIDSKTGETVKNLKLGNQASGNIPFEWDGTNENGELVSSGVYDIQVEAKIDGKNTILATQINSKVESVSLGGSRGLQLNLKGLDAVDFKQVKQIL